ncbi:retrovirus-related pol polyprotein from transposon TNT 1-94 [Tanacetum coccineum]
MDTAYWYKRRCCSLIPAESDSLPHAHGQTTKTYYKHQDSRIKKAQELKTKTSANFDIKDPSSGTKLRGRLLDSFQEDAKYEHVGQDTRSQDGNDDQDIQGKYLKISELKTKSKDNDKGSRSKITQHEGTSLQQYKDQNQDPSTLRQVNLKDLASGKIWAGHPGIKRMLALVEGTYYWPRMEDDVETFVQTCLIYQQDKIEQKKSRGLLDPLPTPKGLWESVSMDFITCLPKSKGSGSII